MKHSLLIMDSPESFNIYTTEMLREIEDMTHLLHPPTTSQNILNYPELLEQVEIIFSSWHMCLLDEEFLMKVPKLEAVFYAAGSVRYFVTDAFFLRGITLTSAYSVNSIPTAEFAFAQILMALKRVHYFIRMSYVQRCWVRDRTISERVPGYYKSTVGLVSLGEIGRRVLKMLQTLDVHIIAYDIHRNVPGVEYCSLDELFMRSDVISLHTALLPSTEGMIKRSLLSKMKEGATIVNTARGKLINEDDLIRVLQERPDLSAYLDVIIHEEDFSQNDPLFDLDNVYITPHLAGSQQKECQRMGRLAIDECSRYLRGESLLYPITKSMLEDMA